ncbi:60S acidic ribosomal protein P2 putative (LIP2) [Leptomonas pyrrhocoris]|uniref:60S acidic ribosomal protein P2 putative (LIP2) n=1 Tax=Leptomonas pyrrhocoris TaxID=157538 RepID=A0A0M9G6H9_LEPPY|nr:60S acidic ribosomal protein P2 putative (LIP2) [Leptomonas pyrrhocoris]XP_015661979.1 60S acidic ribosomal protein P2 putative (LIP2) [Leptomonas pyrrhocoris]XP_015661980.1 60S acidic ribosomal protein P2 putative (LIP2) [Leptomonas pyrrhocoris]KPA83539.1 60S acidic ribosomal protein P2 putative (LIP2) [Leptomonas pyrrhocoris]KPA83540.1 60S acidic ribosomal protein P2 putative (LIP2) [Leptomonas pyrrhocoris]KPA83541.1 60S acidic ribosomal protein P2 putative (LIP2) [Leptomonas pyrrhocoris]|eukprot:XP_015661978.1 60S acidic ribosomal protein P2 putative (LIP2) [Leptomonas pyrrhocoris]
MQYLAAYSLVALSGNAPSKKDVEAVLKAAGVSVDSSRVDAVFAELEGKNLEEVMAEGRSKLVGSGSAAPAAGGAAAPAAGGAAAAADAKKDEPEEEADDDMGFGLFD